MPPSLPHPFTAERRKINKVDYPITIAIPLTPFGHGAHWAGLAAFTEAIHGGDAVVVGKAVLHVGIRVGQLVSRQ